MTKESISNLIKSYARITAISLDKDEVKHDNDERYDENVDKTITHKGEQFKLNIVVNNFNLALTLLRIWIGTSLYVKTALKDFDEIVKSKSIQKCWLPISMHSYYNSSDGDKETGSMIGVLRKIPESKNFMCEIDLIYVKTIFRKQGTTLSYYYDYHYCNPSLLS